jgi:hypothetical protein
MRVEGRFLDESRRHFCRSSLSRWKLSARQSEERDNKPTEKKHESVVKLRKEKPTHCCLPAVLEM